MILFTRALGLAFGTAAVLVGLGCSSLQSTPDQTAWERTQPSNLTSTHKQQLEKANRARQEMFQRLVTTLQSTIDKQGFAGSIDVCAEEVPTIRRDVRTKYNVQIGRTSFRLRNPENAPPQWARKFVRQREEQPVYLRGAHGSLAVLTPIHLQPLCANCHGPKEQLAPGVEEALARRYPEDRATGFRPGELRGWFWVEVPPASTPAKP